MRDISRRRTLALVKLVVATAAATAILAPAAVPQTAAVALDQAVRLALDVQPAMIQAEGERRNARATSRSAWGAYLPTFSTSMSAARSNVGRVDFNTGRDVPSEYSYTLGLNANLELFDGFRRLAQRSAASAGLDAADAAARSQRFQVALATKQVFYDAAAREELVRVGGAQQRRAERQLEVSVDKLRAGSATRSDSLRAAFEVGNARIALLQAQADLAAAQANLGRQIGADQPARALPDTSLPPLPDTEKLRAAELERAPRVAESEAQSRAARAQVGAARSQYWPSLNLSYNDSRQGTGSPFANLGSYPETFSWRFGLSWTLFNGFQREANQVQAAVARDVAESRAADARRELGAQLAQQIAALTTAYAQIDIAAANVAAATEDLRVLEKRYQVGAATILEVLTSQTNLTQAQVNLVQTRFNYLIARAELEALVGGEL